VGANIDVGKDGGTDQKWWGVAGYLHVTPNAWFALTPRFEYLDDSDKFMSGASQNLKEGAVTLEFKHKDGVVMRAEYRRDFSDQEFFAKDDGASSKGQDTVTFGFIYAFSSKAQ
jgi:hypothetical protein